MDIYNHLLQVDERSRELRIYRVDASGKQTLFTSTVLPDTKGWNETTDKLAKQLGENLLMDSPVTRKLLGL